MDPAAPPSPAGAKFDRSMNIRTFGVRITLDFRSLESGRTLISAKSVPKLPSTVVDWGQAEVDLRILLDGIALEITPVS